MPRNYSDRLERNLGPIDLPTLEELTRFQPGPWEFALNLENGSITGGSMREVRSSLSDSDRICQALDDVAEIHPQITKEFEVGVSKMWHDDEFAGGAFALFDPGQQTLLYEHIITPEGRIHFAGEHASLAHAWIQGAIESGLRAAHEIHQG